MDKKNRVNKFPKSIQIMGRKIKIKQGVNLVYKEQPCLGLCDYDNKIIYLEKNQPDQSKVETLVHEATHFFLELTGISQKLDEDTNEMYCQLITALFVDLKKDL
jgi:Zn-dependent peptidase ImmA (M78 family)